MTSQPGDIVRIVARDRTITVLIQLDGKRTSSLFKAIGEFQVMDPLNPVLDIDDTDFSEVQWHKATLNRVRLRKINLCDADLSESKLQFVDFEEVDFTNALLYKCNFLGAKLSHIDFTGADLRNVIFDQAELSHVCFKGANLEGASLQGTVFHGSDLCQALICKDQLTPEQQAQTVLR